MTRIYRRVLVAAIVIVSVAIGGSVAAQTTNLATRLKAAIQAAGVAITDVEIGDGTNKATWKVFPSNLQAAAQPTITAFNINDPAHALAETDARTDAALDAIADDLLTAILENLTAIQAEADAGTLKGNVSVWKQRIRARVKALRRAKGG